MRTAEDIQKEIDGLKNKLATLEGRPTEVYTRIVGYYRSLRNWNKGKREEYNHRLLFGQDGGQEDEKVVEIPEETGSSAAGTPLAAVPVRFMYFYRQTCPNCPAVGSALENVEIPGCEIDVDTEEGMESALTYNIYSTPTVIFFDAQSSEVFRATSTEQITSALAEGLLTISQTA